MGLLDAVGIAPGNNPPPAGPFERSAQYHMQAGQRRQAQRDMSAYVPIGIQRLNEIGTPQAAQAAQLLQQNPKLFFEMAKSYGGAGKWEQIMRAEAQQNQAGRLAGKAAQSAGVPSDLAALYELDPATGASVHKQLYPQEKSYAGVEVYDPDSPTGTRIVSREEAMGQPGAPGSGFSIEIGPDGTQRIVYGRGAGMGGSGSEALTKPTTSKQQDKLITIDDGLARLDRIEDSFDPASFQYSTQMRDWWNRQGSKLGLFGLTPEEARGMSDRAVFRANVYDNINRTIKEITGAQMNKDEAARIIPTQPNLDGTEQEFRAVLANVRSGLEDARDRTAYLLARGSISDEHDFNRDGTPLSIQAFRTKRNRRGDQIAASMREDRPDMSESELVRAVVDQLENELASGVPW